MPFLTLDATHPQRPRIEAMIAAVYAREYGAIVNEFPAHLAALIEKDGSVSCAAGLRFGTFFSEAYLDAPIENILARAVGRPVARSRIVEVTSLAGFRAGNALALVGHIVPHCRNLGHEWAFFTITDRLRALLRRSGLKCLDLAPARRERVSYPERWGSYYECAPRVTAIHASWIPFAIDQSPQSLAL